MYPTWNVVRYSRPDLQAVAYRLTLYSMIDIPFASPHRELQPICARYERECGRPRWAGRNKRPGHRLAAVEKAPIPIENHLNLGANSHRAEAF